MLFPTGMPTRADLLDLTILELAKVTKLNMNQHFKISIVLSLTVFTENDNNMPLVMACAPDCTRCTYLPYTWI